MNVAGKILVVDDSEDIRFLMAALLKSMGHETVIAENGEQALDLLHQDRQIRMVLTDFDMPVMDGLELTRRIRRDEELEDLPVLMQSASPLELLESRAETAGVTRLLPKSMGPDTLMTEINGILCGEASPHVWRALLVGLEPQAASTIRSTLSDAGFQVLQAHDEAQAQRLLQTIDGIDLAFVTYTDPDYGPFVRAHLLRTEKDFQLFRLVLLMATTMPPEKFKGASICVAGYLMNPISPEKISTLLRRLGLASIHGRS